MLSLHSFLFTMELFNEFLDQMNTFDSSSHEEYEIKRILVLHNPQLLVKRVLI